MVFPIFSFGLAVYGENYGDYDIAIDHDNLIRAGIYLTRAESHNVTYEVGYAQFDDVNYTCRVDWLRSIGGRDVVQFWDKDIFGTFLFASRIPINIPALGLTGAVMIDNHTILDAYDSNYNWTKMQMQFKGYLIFITHPPTSDNITDAVMNDGKITVTIAISMDEETNVNLWSFVNWYQSMLTGDQTFGLPPAFLWLVRIMTAVTILATMALIRELIGMT